MTVKIIFNDKQTGPNKNRLADAELFFTNGALEGMKLIGFSIWRRIGTEANPNRFLVTFPARQYSVNGEKRSFALLRETTADAQNRIRDLILEAYDAAINELNQNILEDAVAAIDPPLTAAQLAAKVYE